MQAFFWKVCSEMSNARPVGCTKRNDIVIDPYLGSGTAILAAERTGRRCHAIEIDGRYVDTAIKRWERLTKH
jgi:DNA modification methylase